MDTHKKRIKQLTKDWENEELEFNEYSCIHEWLIKHENKY